MGLEPRARTPENPAVTNNAKVKGRIVLSDDDSDTVVPPPKSTTRRKSRVASRVESPEREIDQAAMALMDIDDGLCIDLVLLYYSLLFLNRSS